MIGDQKSGLVQSAVPQQRNDLIQSDKAGGELTLGADVQVSSKDAASPIAIPDVPTTEAPYDGLVCFGTFLNDAGGDA